MLIDDDRDDVDFFMEAVHSLQKDILLSYFTDPVEAFEQLKISDRLPDLLFLDVNMPRLNGLDLLAKMQQDIRLRDIDVILISSPAETVLRNLVPNFEIGKYISKPTTYSELVSTLRDIL